MKPWHYVTGAVWTTPQGPDDGGQCIATRASASRISPTEKDAALRLCAAAPEMFEALKAARDQIFDGLCAQGEEDPITPQVLAVLDDIIGRVEGN